MKVKTSRSIRIIISENEAIMLRKLLSKTSVLRLEEQGFNSKDSEEMDAFIYSLYNHLCNATEGKG